MNHIKTHILGYPRIGEQRELKKATELYWSGSIPLEQLKETGKTLREQNWKKQAEAGIDLVACNDFSFYDQILDASCLFGNVPRRFRNSLTDDNLNTLFLVARGERKSLGEDQADCQTGKISTFASEMTKWFDTNYHYIVPEFRADTTFQVSTSKIFDEFAEAKALGLNAKPVLIGPVSYISLGKVQDSSNPDFDRFELLEKLLPVYEEILSKLAAQGAEWIQLDEPVCSLDLTETQKDAFLQSYQRLKIAAGSAKLIVANYFGELRENLPLFLSLPVDALHIDGVRADSEVDAVLAAFPTNKILSLGIVNGRNIWKNNYDASLTVIQKALGALGAERLWLAPSCSLQHSPVTLKNEKLLDPEIRDWLAFADQKLLEVTTLARLATGKGQEPELLENRTTQEVRRTSKRIHDERVKAKVSFIIDADKQRKSPFAIRQNLQHEKLQLPLFPTTTIGSFPQTAEVRAARAKWKKGQLSEAEYQSFLEEETRRCVEFQDKIGIDMPVHGEFERNDMVEYFGEQLEGFAFTQNGWVQSYGSRCVKPPFIYGDVRRSQPMTVAWAEFAQTLTKRPMKGMLTGPVTILQWSFVRDDQPRELTTRQIALAIRDEVTDLEKSGIAAIQIDEPAFREGLPLRRNDWDAYLKWAVDAFRLCSCSVEDKTQIHTHMCYSEFNDIIQSIADMDADVITIETSRSNMELLDAFVDFEYPNEIGPGVYDIHSPRVPPVGEMDGLMQKASSLIPAKNLWVNPDCGLKTRGWAEVETSLINMVSAAKQLRAAHAEVAGK